jgi:hypothetical protein
MLQRAPISNITFRLRQIFVVAGFVRIRSNFPLFIGDVSIKSWDSICFVVAPGGVEAYQDAVD